MASPPGRHHTREMSLSARVPRLLATAVLSILTLTLSGCGQADPDRGEPSTTEESATSPTGAASGTESGSAHEQITAGGIAVVVRDHLGADAVRRFVTYEQEPGSVSVMVQLRGADAADNFAVSLYSPESGTDFDQSERCARSRAREGRSEIRCRTLADGTAVTVAEMTGGFSDDNVDGMVLYATVAPPAGGATMAMYESYDASPPLGATDLARIVTDPRLSWLTDPAVNRAGEKVEIRDLEG